MINCVWVFRHWHDEMEDRTITVRVFDGDNLSELDQQAQDMEADELFGCGYTYSHLKFKEGPA